MNALNSYKTWRRPVQNPGSSTFKCHGETSV